MEVELEQEKTIIYNIPEDIRWMPGDTLNATGLRCSRVDNFSQDFDYRLWMEKQMVFYTCFCNGNSELTVIPAATLPVRNLPARLRKEFSETVDRVIPGEDMADTRAVVKALGLRISGRDSTRNRGQFQAKRSHPPAGSFRNASGASVQHPVMAAEGIRELTGCPKNKVRIYHIDIVEFHRLYRMRCFHPASRSHVHNIRSWSICRKSKERNQFNVP